MIRAIILNASIFLLLIWTAWLGFEMTHTAEAATAVAKATMPNLDIKELRTLVLLAYASAWGAVATPLGIFALIAK
jgi:hypothetical protein